MLIKNDHKSSVHQLKLPRLSDRAAGDDNHTGSRFDLSRQLHFALEKIAELKAELEATAHARHQQGFEEGRKLGHAEGLSEIEAQVKWFASAVETLHGQQEVVMQEARQFVVDFSLKITERLLGAEQMQEVQIDAGQLLQLVNDVMNEFSNSGSYVFRVHPTGASIIEQHREKLEAQARGAAISVLTDPSLKPCECVVETDFGILDSTLSARLREVKNFFRKQSSC